MQQMLQAHMLIQSIRDIKKALDLQLCRRGRPNNDRGFISHVVVRHDATADLRAMLCSVAIPTSAHFSRVIFLHDTKLKIEESRHNNAREKHIEGAAEARCVA